MSCDVPAPHAERRERHHQFDVCPHWELMNPTPRDGISKRVRRERFQVIDTRHTRNGSRHRGERPDGRIGVHACRKVTALKAANQEITRDIESLLKVLRC